MIKISIRWELCARSQKAIFFCIISVGMNCRDGSNTSLFTEQQEQQLIRFALMIWLHNISKIIDFILFPLQIIVYFTDYSLFYRLQFRILDYSFPLNAVHFKWEGVVQPYTVHVYTYIHMYVLTYICTYATVQCMQHHTLQSTRTLPRIQDLCVCTSTETTNTIYDPS